MPLAASSGYSPSGIFQTYSPVFRSIALNVPQGGAMAGYPSGSKNLLYPVKRYFMSGGAVSPLESSLFSPLDTNATSVISRSTDKFGNPGILPLPPRMDFV